MHSQNAHYIPVGCIGITRNESHLNPDIWDSIDRRDWKGFALQDDRSLNQNDRVTDHEPYLGANVQISLLKVSKLSPYARLFRAHWARLEFGISSVDDQLGIIRVSMLPDDVQRGTVNRSDASLRKARKLILQSLDYSTEAWKGYRVPVETGELVPFDAEAAKAHQDISLLQLFNTIPSPSPDPGSVLEPYAQDAMYSLLESNIDGLITNLYPYQRRSAALMLQKETQPDQVLDPRLLQLSDTQGSTWYMDPVAGVILLEPRYYDGVSGGILAEEMGSGKTIICLSLILATKNLSTSPPELYRAYKPPNRGKLASLADMAASCATRNAVPWRSYFGAYKSQLGYEFSQCEEALIRNPGYYLLPAPEPRRGGRYQTYSDGPSSKKIFLSSATLVIVPNNLVAQWKQEIQKHTKGLSTLVLVKKDPVPATEDLLSHDIILISQSRFELMVKQVNDLGQSALGSLHFKRCIVDEGHKLGNSKIGNRSDLLLGLDTLHISSRWIVTGTPSHGLFGVDDTKTQQVILSDDDHSSTKTENGLNESSTEMEKKDLERIGAIAALYLKARPWANTTAEAGDTLADWSTYLMLPKHNPKSRGRWDCLQSTLHSLIIRHQLAEIGNLLPQVDERIVLLDGSYQDQLSLNLFSMMIVFNSVQSQRTDMDYFFHQRQKKALLQIVYNLKQASFFGGSFFTVAEISKSVETAEEFLREKKVSISPEDELSLQEAIAFGHLAMNNKLKHLSNQFHEMAVCVAGFPGGAGQSWSLGDESGEDTVCTSTSMLLSLQKLIYNAAGERGDLNSLLNGGLIQEGMVERQKLLAVQTPDDASKPREKKTDTLAGNTKLGDDNAKKSRSHGINGIKQNTHITPGSFSGPLELTMITSTVSAKLKYLIDSIVKYQDEEKIIVFYENDNVAWYLASMLDVLQIQHLIYAKGLTTERRAQYVNTFHHNSQFRVLLMDLSQAAFGLDMRAASRIYFINPVLNPQVEAQAIGRVRRISQKKPVSVETLVLKNSIDEVILERKQHMTQAEHRQAKSILDIRPIFNWIKNTGVTQLEESNGDYRRQMVDLETPLPVFGRGFGRPLHPDEGIILSEDHHMSNSEFSGKPTSPSTVSTLKRAFHVEPSSQTIANSGNQTREQEMPSRPARRVRFTADSDED
ncbi:putative ATP-dependent helicase C23E6.02-like protein [Cladobotryum mycophilum]|uniref:ATP-dependent helicase C23E6.02-like protein n=1 Tax=Cladobotryum mycophilum TaxID=491253 RepID=A0ABR0SF86_9HYPO